MCRDLTAGIFNFLFETQISFRLTLSALLNLAGYLLENVFNFPAIITHFDAKVCCKNLDSIPKHVHLCFPGLL